MTGCLITIAALASYAQTFQHDMETSREMAKEQEKNILMVFSGSDWCKSCMQLKESILGTENFVQFSDEQLVLLELDFPYRKKNQLPEEQRLHNEQLAEQYNQDGAFPKVVLLNPDKEVLGEITYEKNMQVAQFIQLLEIILEKKS